MGSGNWIVDNLNSALEMWNGRLAEIWTGNPILGEYLLLCFRAFILNAYTLAASFARRARFFSSAARRFFSACRVRASALATTSEIVTSP